jgi:hypothetical protein
LTCNFAKDIWDTHTQTHIHYKHTRARTHVRAHTHIYTHVYVETFNLMKLN